MEFGRPLTLMLCSVFLLILSLQCAVLGDAGKQGQRGWGGGGGGATGNPPTGRRLLQVGAEVDEQNHLFQEELRSAMNSHWDILQKIRYHTLTSKMKVAQLDKKVKMLTQQIGSLESGNPTTSAEVPCDEEPNKGKQGNWKSESQQQNEVRTTLLASLRELSQFYESFNYTTGSSDPEQPMNVDGGFEKIRQVLEKLKALAGRRFQTDSVKRLTRKSTKVLNATLIMTTAATVNINLTTTEISEDPGPSIRNLVVNITVYLGSTASLRCRVVNPGPSTVVWTQSNAFGGFDILTAGQYLYSSNNRHGIFYDALSKDWILTIKEVMANDEGRYRCEVNTVPSISKNFHLIVEDDPQPLIVSSHTTNASALIGTTASLNCRVSSLGSHAVSWRGTDHYGTSVLLTYGENSYASDRRIGITHHRGSHDWTLTIRDVTNADEGSYSCEVNSIPTSLSRTISLTVVESHLQSTPLPFPEYNITVHQGSSYVLNCTTDIYANDQVFWIREEDHQIFTTEKSIGVPSAERRIYASRDSESTWLLTIRDLRGNDEGTFKCLRSPSSALSPNSVIVQTVHLNVDTEPFVISTSSRDSVISKEGSTALLHCRVSNLGNYTVAWTRLNLNGSSDILTVGLFTFEWNTRLSVRLDSKQNDWILKVKNVNPMDEGVYQCQINTHPAVSHSVTLDVVEPRSTTSSPSHERNITVEEGEDAMLSCYVQDLGDASVSWVRSSDLQVLTAGEFTLYLDARFKAHTDDNETWHLQIDAVRKEDEGGYLCQVSTDSVISNQFWLTVIGNHAKDLTTDLQSLTTPIALTTAVPYCFHPFEIISGDLCILHISLQKLSWIDASQYCRSKGGKLAVDLQDSLRPFLEQHYGIEGKNWTMWPFWIGAKEERNPNGERMWRWLNGSFVDAKSWAPYQPRRYGMRKAPQGSCMTLDGNAGYTGVALPCHYRRRFVCLKQP